MDMQSLLHLSVKQHASDLHIAAGSRPLLRREGELIPLLRMPILDEVTAKNLIYSVMTKEQQDELERVCELDFRIAIPGVAGFRVNVFFQMKGFAAVFRVIPDRVPTMEQLNLPIAVKQLLDLPHGLILVTGPTGSGKSTTLAAMIDDMNEREALHIITIEDPIEFTHHNKKSLINQRQVHRDTKDISIALRSALREDPDVLLVGEMRDLETIRLALTAAETGHLVMATLHASSAPRAVSRLLDVFPPGEKGMIRNMLAESLQGVVCQTLLKKTTGGRVPAFEMMLGTPAIRHLIREDKIAQMYSVMQTGAESGMVTLDQSLQTLVSQQWIDPMLARKLALNKTLF